ncbi:MAG: SRPBCC family protein [Pseudomonadales bacterium]
MSYEIHQQLNAQLPAAKVWQVLEDYPAVVKYAPTVKDSACVSEHKSGLGAKRKVTFHHDGSSLIEEITDYREGQGYTMQVSALSAPLVAMQADIDVYPSGERDCQIKMHIQFEVKPGFLGRLMATLLLKPMMGKVALKLITGLAYYAVTAQAIDKHLPAKQVLVDTIGQPS